MSLLVIALATAFADEPVPAPMWRAQAVEIAGDAEKLVFTLDIPDGHKIQPDAVAVRVVEASDLQIGEHLARHASSEPQTRPFDTDLVELELPVVAAGLSGTDQPLKLEITHHFCAGGMCFPRVTQELDLLVHVTGIPQGHRGLQTTPEISGGR